MREYIEIGSCPPNEAAVQVEPTGEYIRPMREQCSRFIEAIRKKLGKERGSASLGIKSNPHDFGRYLEVVCFYNSNDEEGMEYAMECERNSPLTWEDTKTATSRV
jgi:hypothetical protein